MKLNIRLLAASIALCLLLSACSGAVPPQDDASVPQGPSTDISDPDIPIGSPDPVIPEPEAESFVLSFAGDCTLGNNYDAENASGTFRSVVKDNYAYPFSNVKQYFENDDFTFVNLECALTESDPTEEEMVELSEHQFRFRGPASYAKILVEGNVEFASVANNHSKDYGKQGLYDTWDALEAENIHYASFNKTCLATTESGLKIGIIAIFFNFTDASMRNQIKALKDKGAELIVVSIHWGDEGTYEPNSLQQSLGRRAINNGANIVYGHHSHTLQRIEPYNGGVIYYSLGNFSFGGNRNPSDKDTAVIQQEVLRYTDGSVGLGDLEIIPCRVSTVDNWNDFRPTPYEKDHPGYDRVLSKLEGSFNDFTLKDEVLPAS